jgi:hypothetical protein
MTQNPEPDPQDRPAILEIYKLMVEMADRVSQRRQAANNFYLSVNTAIIGASVYLSAFHPSWISVLIMGLAGFCVSVLWIRNIQSYKELNEGKFHVITRLEQTLPISPYQDEWDFLHHGGRDKRYMPFHAVEILVPWVFVGVHLLQIVAAIPWKALASNF